MLNKYVLLILSLLCTVAIAQEEVKKCPKCGHIEKRQSAQYCIYCGVKLEKAQMKRVLMCPKCKVPIDRGGKFCVRCGTKGVLRDIAIAEENFEPALIPSKGFPQAKSTKQVLIYPSATFLREYDIEENLYHTAQNRSIVRKVFLCPAKLEEVETFYRSNYSHPSVLRAYAHNCFHLLNLKIQFPEQEIQIMFFSVTPNKDPKLWQVKCDRLKEKFLKQLAPAQKLEKKILRLKQRFHKGENLTQLEDLQERHSIFSNSSTYWNASMMYQALSLKQNLLLITQIIKK